MLELAAANPRERSIEAWAAPLLAPFAVRIEAVLGRFGDVGVVPRRGLGSALALHVMRTWGRRRWQEAARVAIVGIESYNTRVFIGDASGAWTHGDASRARRVWQGLAKRDAALLNRVIDRALLGFGEAPVPEAVLLCRGAVGAAVLCADIAEEEHVRLDRVATALGLRIERAYGALTPTGWAGAWRAVGYTPTEGASLDDILVELLPDADSDFVERLTQSLDALTTLVDTRRFRAMEPKPAPILRALGVNPLERALRAASLGGGAAFDRSTSFLQGQGGKRLRPALVLAACQACGGDEMAALAPGALLEWLHQASLVLDDIVDDAPVRRNGPTLHAATDVPWAVAVAAYLLARIHQQARELPIGVRDALRDAAETLAEGQRAELAHTGDHQLPVAAYFRIIEAKTARLFANAAVLGARTANAPEREVRALARFGREIGLAFQIVDDVLDWFGDERVFGKRPGTDLRAGKVTLPLLLLRDRLDVAGRVRLADVLESPPDVREAAFPWILAKMAELGVEADAMARARTHRDRALAALDARVTPELAALADALVERRR